MSLIVGNQYAMMMWLRIKDCEVLFEINSFIKLIGMV